MGTNSKNNKCPRYTCLVKECIAKKKTVFCQGIFLSFSQYLVNCTNLLFLKQKRDSTAIILDIVKFTDFGLKQPIIS